MIPRALSVALVALLPAVLGYVLSVLWELPPHLSYILGCVAGVIVGGTSASLAIADWFRRIGAEERSAKRGRVR